MGAAVTRTDFEWVYTEEPHASRRKEILAKYPQIKKLFGYDKKFKWIVLLMISIQVVLMHLMQDQSWLVIFLVAYCIGGVINHSLMLAIHEISHNLAFGHSRPLANRLFGIFTNLVIGFPFSVTFKNYHLEHHRYQGDEKLDTDIPTSLEAKLFCTTFGKFIWLFLQPLFYALRPVITYPKPLTTLELVNAFVQLTFDAFVYYYFGGKVLAYLTLGSLLAMGLHPVAGHFISEHYMFKKGYETYSYYGPLNWITFNVGYHNEHHDFPAVPGSLLPEVKRIAPEYYENLPQHNSWVSVLYDFVMDPDIGPYARIKRRHKGFSTGTASHQLSATALLPSPDRNSRHLFDIYDFLDDDFLGVNFRGHRAGPSRSSGFWDCFIVCRHKLDHQVGKRKIEQGLKLYNQHKQQAAVRKWKSALKRIRKRDDKFLLLGYLFQAHMDWGKYRDSQDFAQKQLIISEEMDSPNMRAEAYLNLALAHERMGALERALTFARHSLYNECSQCRTAGLVHITIGSVYLEMANFFRALSSFQRAHKIATSLQDSKLELQVYIGLSELFGRLQDADKSALYASKAYDLSRSLQPGDLNTRHHRNALLQMASSLCKQGELGDAHDYCVEATKFALLSGDQATYARSIRIMGDIYRKKSDINKAFRQYESAINASTSMGDRLCQMQAMDGAAKCLESLRLQQKICNCRPLEFNTRLLEVANAVGAKLLVRTIRLRLSQIYRSLRDEEHQQLHERVARSLEVEMELHCGACNSPLGLEADSLEALPCAHILHARCAYDLMRRKDKKKKKACPDCHKSVSSRLYLHSNEPTGSCLGFHSNRSSLSLASLSLRNSSLSLGQQATSSV